MSISSGQPANETSFNDAFMSRTTDTSTTGKIAQSNTTESSAPANGALTTAGGLGVAKNVNIGGTLSTSKTKNGWKTYTLQSIAAGGTVNYDTDQAFQYRRIQSTGGAVTLADKIFGASIAGINDGDVFRFVGFSDSEVVIISHADVQYGCLLNGDARLGRGQIIEVQYDSVMERFIQSGRNI